MAHPGWTFGIMLAVAIGTAMYYYFRNENPRLNYETASPFNLAPPPRSVNQSPRHRRRRNSNDSEKDCVICFDVLKASSIKQLTCGHKFHADCINMWLNVRDSCPICRSSS
ncbi:hypothetical protein PPYR_03828 [Photinus pyralis]|uniref:RING-type domain-containing protein n=1 Tax=Photinus pyralis TaxID=7054 RepID=A0A1Y1M3E0_PHOPY|nr:RING-H2 finger protein ATL63-like [Photinus pyralis]XP_031333505.1 RING-H2 finger protein ATL63-like [Photinus pyralis]KAB0801642.1 hypothetical protein PPYR_03828 [Photinus pyralis]